MNLFSKWLSLLLLCCLFFPLPLQSQANVDDLENKIKDYTQKLNQLSSQKDTLSNQIKIIDSEVEITLLKISQSEITIRSLEIEINSLSDKIGELDQYLNKLSADYIRQVVQNYKLRKANPFFILLQNRRFNSIFEQYKYLSALQKNSQNTLVNLETARTNYNFQKNQKEQKQAEVEHLKSVLADQQANLASQRDSKNKLLVVTRNDEAKYQKLKQEAENELSYLLKAKYVGKRVVKKGDVLGLMGNSGYSFGDHLHFGLYSLAEDHLASWSYPNDIDPFGYLNQHRWPMEDYRITQGRGKTAYSYLYSDHFHHGVDMVSGNKSVRAVEDGVAYFYRNPGSSLGNHVRLFHADGKMSLYLHLQ